MEQQMREGERSGRSWATGGWISGTGLLAALAPGDAVRPLVSRSSLGAWAAPDELILTLCLYGSGQRQAKTAGGLADCNTTISRCRRPRGRLEPDDDADGMDFVDLASFPR